MMVVDKGNMKVHGTFRFHLAKLEGVGRQSMEALMRIESWPILVRQT